MPPEPGRELDALVAEKVMGWSQVAVEQDIRAFRAGDYMSDVFHEMPHYSTSVASAWQIVETLVGRGWRAAVCWSPAYQGETERADCRFEGGGESAQTDYSVAAETVPLAVCLAALKVVGYDIG